MDEEWRWAGWTKWDGSEESHRFLNFMQYSQGSVLAPLNFTIYTDDIGGFLSVHLLYPDDIFNI